MLLIHTATALFTSASVIGVEKVGGLDGAFAGSSHIQALHGPLAGHASFPASRHSASPSPGGHTTTAASATRPRCSHWEAAFTGPVRTATVRLTVNTMRLARPRSYVAMFVFCGLKRLCPSERLCPSGNSGSGVPHVSTPPSRLPSSRLYLQSRTCRHTGCISPRTHDR